MNRPESSLASDRQCLARYCIGSRQSGAIPGYRGRVGIVQHPDQRHGGARVRRRRIGRAPGRCRRNRTTSTANDTNTARSATWFLRVHIVVPAVDAGLEKFDEGNDHAALGDQRAEEPFQKIRFHSLDAGFGLLPQGFDVGLDRGDIGLGGEIGVEEGDMLFGEGLDLLLGEAAFGQTLDEAMSVEGDSLRHGPIIATPRQGDKDYRYSLSQRKSKPTQSSTTMIFTMLMQS